MIAPTSCGWFAFVAGAYLFYFASKANAAADGDEIRGFNALLAVASLGWMLWAAIMLVGEALELAATLWRAVKHPRVEVR